MARCARCGEKLSDEYSDCIVCSYRDDAFRDRQLSEAREQNDALVRLEEAHERARQDAETQAGVTQRLSEERLRVETERLNIEERRERAAFLAELSSEVRSYIGKLDEGPATWRERAEELAALQSAERLRRLESIENGRALLDDEKRERASLVHVFFADADRLVAAWAEEDAEVERRKAEELAQWEAEQQAQEAVRQERKKRRKAQERNEARDKTIAELSELKMKSSLSGWILTLVISLPLAVGGALILMSPRSYSDDSSTGALCLLLGLGLTIFGGVNFSSALGARREHRYRLVQFEAEYGGDQPS